jgi:hypothetical protein
MAETGLAVRARRRRFICTAKSPDGECREPDAHTWNVARRVVASLRLAYSALGAATLARLIG